MYNDEEETFTLTSIGRYKLVFTKPRSQQDHSGATGVRSIEFQSIGKSLNLQEVYPKLRKNKSTIKYLFNLDTFFKRKYTTNTWSMRLRPMSYEILGYQYTAARGTATAKISYIDIDKNVMVVVVIAMLGSDIGEEFIDFAGKLISNPGQFWLKVSNIHNS